MTILTNDFAPPSERQRTLLLEDFAGDKFQLAHYPDSIDTDGFNVDVLVTESGEESSFSLTRDDALVLVGVLAKVLLDSEVE